MNTFDIDGKKVAENQNEYLKEIFDLPVFEGDFEDIYFYLSGFYSKTVINLTNSEDVDPLLIDAFERAAEANELVSLNIED
ncbi:hypothetical protein [Methanosphaera sp. WGK6]|uniref:hypothetical protein n=1 Tax=Methanosphaera sp. WGK6 TaxID=1561964 RepID=UPI00084C3C58|nr:hypothetical protein [Methanosphaera sp. WGK6]OED30365.1 hypothetical protein NL43_03045 [Methanosphaera sp. WGK6]